MTDKRLFFALDEWISTGEAANMTGYVTNYIREMARRGKIESRKFGHFTMINKDSVVEHKQKMSEKKYRCGPRKAFRQINE